MKQVQVAEFKDALQEQLSRRAGHIERHHRPAAVDVLKPAAQADTEFRELLRANESIRVFEHLFAGLRVGDRER